MYFDWPAAENYGIGHHWQVPIYINIQIWWWWRRFRMNVNNQHRNAVTVQYCFYNGSDIVLITLVVMVMVILEIKRTCVSIHCLGGAKNTKWIKRKRAESSVYGRGLVFSGGGTSQQMLHCIIARVGYLSTESKQVSMRRCQLIGDLSVYTEMVQICLLCLQCLQQCVCRLYKLYRYEPPLHCSSWWFISVYWEHTSFFWLPTVAQQCVYVYAAMC